MIFMRNNCAVHLLCAADRAVTSTQYLPYTKLLELRDFPKLHLQPKMGKVSIMVVSLS